MLPLGTLVCTYRREAKLTQRELAARTGLSVAALRDYEQGRRQRLRPGTLAALARGLGLSADQRADLTRAAAIPRRSPSLVPLPRSGRNAFGATPLPGPPGGDQGVRLSLLGPLEVWRDGTPLSLGPPARRAVLGLLVLDLGMLVRRDTIIDVLWRGAPPRTATDLVQAHVSRIRGLLELDKRVTDAGRMLDRIGRAYRLVLSVNELDLLAFRDLAACAAEAQANGDLATACDLYADAIGLWRGEPLADVDVLSTHPGVTALKQELAGVLLKYAAVACAVGQPYRVLPQLQVFADAEPLDELAHAWLMMALAGAGQQAAAIRVYEEIRLRLDRDLGLYPGKELSEAYLRVLRQDVRSESSKWAHTILPALTAGLQVAPRQLPAAPRGFIGRADELRALFGLLERDSGESGSVSIVALTGMAGIGKTALAVHWAHRVADLFPDGQLFVNLRGSSPDEPVLPAQAVRGFLTALGAPPARIPPDADGQAALYRTLLVGRRMLIVLDNAQNADQIRPLLPGAPGCVVLVTSRNLLLGLAAGEGAQLITLDVLTDAESCALLFMNLGERTSAEPEAVRELIALCGHLPLALRDIAARAIARPGLPFSALVTEMREARNRLDVLETGEWATSVRVAFSWSQAKLGDQAARMFRLLGIHPGPDVTVSTAASLAGVPREKAYLALTELCAEHLLTEYAPGRYSLHDLLRAYAAEWAHSSEGGAELRAAARRVFDYYLHTADVAAGFLCPCHTEVAPPLPAPGVVIEAIAGPDRAATWFEREQDALLGVIGQAVKGGYVPHAWDLPWVAGWYMSGESYWRSLLTMQKSALEVAVSQRDPAGQAIAHQHLGWLKFLLGDMPGVDEHLGGAAELARQLNDKRLRALVGVSMAYVLHSRGRTAQAVAQAKHALWLYQTAGGRGGETGGVNSVSRHFVRLQHGPQLAEITALAFVLYREYRYAAG